MLTMHKPLFSQAHHETSPHNIVQTPTICPTPRAVGSRGLNWSTEVFQRTPRLHQTHLLWEPSSSETGMAASFRERLRA